MMKTFLFLVVVPILLLVGLFRHINTQSQPNQKEFLKGKVPTAIPDGFLKGEVNAKSDWLGKKFDVKSGKGINVFSEGENSTERYTFSLSTGKGLVDPIEVIKLNYNIPTNPFWLRLVTDELVEISSGKYLGKLIVNLGPIHLALGFFTLSK